VHGDVDKDKAYEDEEDIKLMIDDSNELYDATNAPEETPISHS
jgi:hypothetical protein